MDFPPFFYGSHYSNSGIVLHYLIRLPPYTQHFLQYQGMQKTVKLICYLSTKTYIL